VFRLFYVFSWLLHANFSWIPYAAKTSEIGTGGYRSHNAKRNHHRRGSDEVPQLQTWIRRDPRQKGGILTRTKKVEYRLVIFIFGALEGVVIHIRSLGRNRAAMWNVSESQNLPKSESVFDYLEWAEISRSILSFVRRDRRQRRHSIRTSR